MKQILLLILTSPLLTHSHQVLFYDQTYLEDNRINNGLRARDSKFGTGFLTYPGTKWCGPGNTANSEDDLGVDAETDKCCRSHDFCDDILEMGETKHNLTNKNLFTRLNCKCDQEFHDCLKTVNNYNSNMIGLIYFNVLFYGRCFKSDYPIIKCKNYVHPGYKCIDYELDTHANKKYQWFDRPYFEI